MRRFVRKDASSEPRELQGGAGGGDLWEEIVAAECGVGAVVRSRELLDGKRCQYLYFCTSKASKLPVSAQEVGVSSGRPVKALLWLY